MSNINERVDKMAKWAAVVDKKISELSAKLAPSTEETDSLLNEISGLHTLYDFIPQSRNEKQIELIDIDMEVDALKELVSDMEDSAYLDVSMIMGEGGKLAYTNETMRKSASKKTLKKNDEYTELTTRLNDELRKQRIKKAELDQLSDLEKEYSRRNLAIVAQVNYVTAKMTGE